MAALSSLVSRFPDSSLAGDPTEALSWLGTVWAVEAEVGTP